MSLARRDLCLRGELRLLVFKSRCLHKDRESHEFLPMNYLVGTTSYGLNDMPSKKDVEVLNFGMRKVTLFWK